MKNNDIAIIGMSVLLPKIFSIRDFWQHTKTDKNFFCPVPTEHWNHFLYQGICHANNGGFLDEIAMDLEQFGLKEQHIPFIDPRQLLTLECVRCCFEDAGYHHRDFDRENTSVILACGSNSGALRAKYEFSAQLAQHQTFCKSELPEWSQHSYIGSLDNIISGRVAHCFGLEGKNFVVDACCASAMSAISIAISELQTGQSSVVVTGGVDTLTEYEYLGLDKTGVLSHSGNSRSFSSDADGSVISEGAAILLLKRKEDAIRDGDSIHAIIKGFGASSNGKNKSLSLPSPQHQLKALNRAYQFSGVSPQVIEFIEGHGNATKIGDTAEAETIVQFLEDNDVEHCALSTCKATLGHTRAIAGVVGIIRTTLALKHKVIPLHAQQKNILPVLHNDRVHLPAKPQPWLGKYEKRSAGVNAFGFGGTNYHVVLEEYTPKDPVCGGQDWPWEILLFESHTTEDLVDQLQRISTADMRLAEHAYHCCMKVTGEKPLRLAMLASDIHMFEELVQVTLDALTQNDSLPRNVFLQKTEVRRPKIAFLFNGQGSQCLHMAREMFMYLPQFQFADNAAQRNIMHRIFANGDSSASTIHNTEIAQPALAMIHQGYHALLQDLQINPDIAAGHSFGEISAFYCSGALTAEQHFQMSVARGQVMSGDGEGGMLSVFGEIDLVVDCIKNFSDVVVANYNCPQQIVLSGNIKTLEKIHHQFPQSQFIKVSHAFHSPQMQQAQTDFAKHIEGFDFKEPIIPVYTNTTGKEVQRENMKTTVVEQITSPVLFHDMIQRMHDEGVELFLEIGPKNVVRNLVKNIVPQASSMAIDPKNGEIHGLLQTIAELYTHGVDMRLDALFTARHLDLSEGKTLSSENIWWVNGVRARKEKMSKEPSQSLRQIHQYFSSLHKEEDEHRQPIFHTRNDMNEKGINEKDDVMLSYQETMRKFLETQQQIMSLYLTEGGNASLSLPQNISTAVSPPQFGENTGTRLGESREKISEEPHGKMKSMEKVTQEIHEAYDENVEKAFLQVVAQKTGYPVASLSLQHMIAEDLGIDSIKRVEIFEALKEKFVIVEEQSGFSAVTLKDIFDTIQKNNGEHVAAKDTDTRTTIIEIIAELTGYPQYSIQENHMLAEELGIDSIKRMEIFDALKQRFTVDDEITHTLLTASSVNDIAKILSANTKKK
ncbi:polyketide synthase [Candidatus Uabimicrobium amorphum]|uniref:Polyketide synthase n=3 Tax=Uabimicrobium amorphum TaxID=2596890 RepID=A0A5S9IUF4_UABAM|nr:type I polyketide synthase [Candidatus Uabimicrobium amorphum]BBM88319.1 polyketide synthase [Candidatus Uabimicrobium amorphum]